MKQFDLIPVTIKMLTANNKGITILGATILRISEQGKIVETNDINIQMTYITDNLDKLFVSREAWVVLVTISESFPTVGEIIEPQRAVLIKAPANTRNINVIGSISGLITVCDCPKR